MIRAVAKPWIDQGATGSIINVSSVFGLRGGPFQGVYAMTKAAIVSMTETLAIELGRQGVRVNAICPGLVETKFAEAMLQTDMISQKYTERAALGRWAQPDEIGGLVRYLASDESSYVTGQSFVIDGGYLIGF
jgi:NAD(P)-dependent dehydrogenase (short-subunit alcohol dehydrogenase family)